MSNQLPDFTDINVRRSIYQEAYRLHLEDLEHSIKMNLEYNKMKYSVSGMCNLIFIASQKLYPEWNCRDFSAQNEFPEFAALKPKESEMHSYWWWDRRDYEIRKQIFEQHLINI